MLREGNGAAFLVFPACGEIRPFQEEIIEVTGFSDMWGEYNDNMVVKVTYTYLFIWLVINAVVKNIIFTYTTVAGFVVGGTGQCPGVTHDHP